MENKTDEELLTEYIKTFDVPDDVKDNPETREFIRDTFGFATYRLSVAFDGLSDAMKEEAVKLANKVFFGK